MNGMYITTWHHWQAIIMCVHIGVRVEVPHRDPSLPVIYEVPDHPLRHSNQHPGKNYVYIQDTNPDALEKLWEAGQRIKIPQGTRKELGSSGFLDLLPGDAVFARDLHGSQRPEDDVIQCWLTDRFVLFSSYCFI
jgi:hypothetical protein